MKSRYDALVIGGGPGGAIAAGDLAGKGLSVCLVEKRPAIGAPVRCAEGIGKDILKEFIEPDERWISAEIRGARIVAPDGTAMTLEQEMAGSKVGYILDRKVFDRELVWQAACQGAEVHVKTRATGPIVENGAVKGAVLETCGQAREVRADVVIAADGVESKFPRWCGVDSAVPLRELMSCAQYLLTDIDIDPFTTAFYLGNKVAPEGYAWVFPKGERTANVGIGISARRSRDGNRARDYLDRFVAAHFPEGKTIEYIVGGVPVCRPLPCTVADGLMIIGDSARVADPMTGGGIYNAMHTGRLAAGVASESISAGDCSSAALMAYDQAWRHSKFGKNLERNYRIKEYFITLSDEKLNAIVHSISKMNLKDFSVFNLVKELIRRNPRLLLELKGLHDSLSAD
ncbi:MAG TPA: NAD(P)/FAD-dependent oxidoreductase [Methanomicrobiales archaeon]|nr:NAD(P)/FAD-dependent oxidoreductase [Methanomicrobiales archaeon]